MAEPPRASPVDLEVLRQQHAGGMGVILEQPAFVPHQPLGIVLVRHRTGQALAG